MPHRRLLATIDAVTPRIYILICIVSLAASALLYGYAVHLSREIQHERANSILRACTSQNARRDHAIVALFDVLKKSGVPEKKRKAAAAPAITLINALAPKQNCKMLVARSVSGRGSKTTPTTTNRRQPPPPIPTTGGGQ